jgi:hypothetical protein
MTSLPSQRGEQGTDHTLESTMLFDNSVTDHGRGFLYWWGTENKSNKHRLFHTAITLSLSIVLWSVLSVHVSHYGDCLTSSRGDGSSRPRR